MKRLLILCLAALFLLGAACGTPSPAPQPEATVPPTEAPETEPDIVAVETIAPTPTVDPTTPTPEPTPTPSPTPSPTPRPGDIAINFPDYDTGVDADYSYQSDELRIAITVYEGTLRDEAENRDLASMYYVTDIWVKNLRSMRKMYGKGQFNKHTENADKFAKRENAIVAVHGNNNEGLVLHEGEVYQNLRQYKGWNSKSVCIIYKDGSMKTFYLPKEPLNLEQEIANGAWYGWQFGPIIIRDYKKGPDITKYKKLGYKARTMLGYYEPGHYVLVVADQRGSRARGLSGLMMYDLMKSLGVKEAFNLDGGTSAVLVFMGEIINRPVYGKTEDGNVVYGRPILDLFGFGEYDEETGAFAPLSSLTGVKYKDKE